MPYLIILSRVSETFSGIITGMAQISRKKEPRKASSAFLAKCGFTWCPNRFCTWYRIQLRSIVRCAADMCSDCVFIKVSPSGFSASIFAHSQRKRHNELFARILQIGCWANNERIEHNWTVLVEINAIIALTFFHTCNIINSSTNTMNKHWSWNIFYLLFLKWHHCNLL